MDASKARKKNLKHRFRRAVDSDDLYFKYSISISFGLEDVQSMLKEGTAYLVKKPPVNCLVNKLKLSDKIAYVKYIPNADPSTVLCSNIAACRKCKEVFSYTSKRNILSFCRSHKCRMQSDEIINTCRSPGSCSSVRNINMCEPPGNIGENLSDVQDVNGSDMIVCSINTCKPPGNTIRNISDVNDSGLRTCSINTCESPGNTYENISNLEDVNNSDMVVCTCKSLGNTDENISNGNTDENISNFQDINRNGSSIYSINTCESPGYIVENTSDLQDVNGSDMIVCSINTCKPPGNTSRNISNVNDSDLRICSINTCESPGNTSENISNLEDVNNSDMVVCTCKSLGNTDENLSNVNTDENISNLQDINRNGSSICSINTCESSGYIVENTSDLQDANGSDMIVCSINTCKPPGNTSRNISDVNDSGLRICSINTCESPGNTCENISSLEDVNNSDMVVCTCKSLGNTNENISNLQGINRSGSSICSINMCESPGNIVENISDLQDLNRSSSSICSIRQENGIEIDLQNCENNDNEEIVVGNTEEYMHSTENVVQLDDSIQDENMELNTTLNVTDDESIEEISNVPVTESVHEETANDNRNNSKNVEGMTVRDVALIGLHDKLDNPFESVVVTDLYNYNLIVTMNEFYKTGRFTDASIVCENQKIECHRLVLSMFSAHFEEVFRECHTNHSAVAIEGLKFWQVKALIDYMYTTEVKVEDRDWTLLMEAADKLQFRDYLRPSKLPRNSAKKRVRL